MSIVSCSVSVVLCEDSSASSRSSSNACVSASSGSILSMTRRPPCTG
ncbi:Uncharacterised protein [Mycobacteroides abscessus subsp. abscessus]|nr:Uncharacterised protein [Mycobacteroides abscessus subsp. abscessus]